MSIRLVGFFLFAVSGVATAQTACPGGVAAGSAQCGPSPASHQSGQSAPAPPVVRHVDVGEWKDSWGAISADPIKGVVGGVIGMQSEDSAREIASSRCADSGGKSCEMLLVYANQCAAVAWPETLDAKVVSNSDLTIEKASKKALDTCVKLGGGKCEVVYSTCSERILEMY